MLDGCPYKEWTVEIYRGDGALRVIKTSAREK